jgi:hypothetical protein
MDPRERADGSQEFHEQEKEVLLLPCSGDSQRGRPRSHLYEVWVGTDYPNQGVSKGYMRKEEALRLYPDAVETNSDSLCAECAADLRRRAGLAP